MFCEAMMLRHTDSHAEDMAACSGDVLYGVDILVGWIFPLSIRDQSIGEDLCEISISISFVFRYILKGDWYVYRDYFGVVMLFLSLGVSVPPSHYPL